MVAAWDEKPMKPWVFAKASCFRKPPLIHKRDVHCVIGHTGKVNQKDQNKNTGCYGIERKGLKVLLHEGLPAQNFPIERDFR